MNRSRIVLLSIAALALSACMSEPALADNQAKGIAAPVEQVATTLAPYAQPVSFETAVANSAPIVGAGAKLSAFKFVDVETAFAVYGERTCAETALMPTDYMTATGADKPDKRASRDEVRGLARKSETAFST